MENLSDSNMFSVAGEEIIARYASNLCGAEGCAGSKGEAGGAGSGGAGSNDAGAGGTSSGDAGSNDAGSGDAGGTNRTSNPSNATDCTGYAAPQSAECLFLAFSESPLSEKAKTALAKTAESFGIPAKKCLFATLSSVCGTTRDNVSSNNAYNNEPGTSARNSATSNSAYDNANSGDSSSGTTNNNAPSDNVCANRDALSEKDVFAIIEGLDPKMLVICDNATCELALAAYRRKAYAPTLPLEKRARLFGRRCVAFASFESLLTSPENKQRAWAALKTLRD